MDVFGDTIIRYLSNIKDKPRNEVELIGCVRNGIALQLVESNALHGATKEEIQSHANHLSMDFIRCLHGFILCCGWYPIKEEGNEDKDFVEMVRFFLKNEKGFQRFLIILINFNEMRKLANKASEEYASEFLEEFFK